MDRSSPKSGLCPGVGRRCLMKRRQRQNILRHRPCHWKYRSHRLHRSRMHRRLHLDHLLLTKGVLCLHPLKRARRQYRKNLYFNILAARLSRPRQAMGQSRPRHRGNQNHHPRPIRNRFRPRSPKKLPLQIRMLRPRQNRHPLVKQLPHLHPHRGHLLHPKRAQHRHLPRRDRLYRRPLQWQARAIRLRARE